MSAINLDKNLVDSIETKSQIKKLIGHIMQLISSREFISGDCLLSYKLCVLS